MSKCGFEWTDAWVDGGEPHVCFRDNGPHDTHLCTCDASRSVYALELEKKAPLTLPAQPAEGAT